MNATASLRWLATAAWVSLSSAAAAAPAPSPAPAPPAPAPPAPAPPTQPAAAPATASGATAAPASYGANAEMDGAGFDASSHEPTAPEQAPFVAAEFEAALEIDVSTSDLNAAPGFFVGGGARLLLGPGSLGLGLRAGYERYKAWGTSSFPACGAGTTGGCLPSGSYRWFLRQQVFNLGLAISYRFLPPDSLLVPYVGVTPQLYVMRSNVTAYENKTTQGDVQPGVSAAIGARARLGPGGVFTEIGGQYAPLDPRDPDTDVGLTGDAHLGAFVVAVGYRLELEQL